LWAWDGLQQLTPQQALAAVQGFQLPWVPPAVYYNHRVQLEALRSSSISQGASREAVAAAHLGQLGGSFLDERWIRSLNTWEGAPGLEVYEVPPQLDHFIVEWAQQWQQARLPEQLLQPWRRHPSEGKPAWSGTWELLYAVCAVLTLPWHDSCWEVLPFPGVQPPLRLPYRLQQLQWFAVAGMELLVAWQLQQPEGDAQWDADRHTVLLQLRQALWDNIADWCTAYLREFAEGLQERVQSLQGTVKDLRGVERRLRDEVEDCKDQLQWEKARVQQWEDEYGRMIDRNRQLEQELELLAAQAAAAGPVAAAAGGVEVPAAAEGGGGDEPVAAGDAEEELSEPDAAESSGVHPSYSDRGSGRSRGRGRSRGGIGAYMGTILLLCVLLVGVLTPVAAVAAGLGAELALLGTRGLAGPCFRWH
jgi:hypothetical protein